MLQAVKPRNARSARALKAREPQTVENAKIALFLRYTSCSEIVQLVLRDLYSLRRPLAIKFQKKNNIHPFEDASSFEFFAEKNDTSLLAFGSNSKKRPHAVTLVRCFDHKVLDMLELLADPETMRSISQFKNSRKPAVGLKPLVCFAGTVFESPTPNEYTLAKSILLDFFKGSDTDRVDVEGLQYMICISSEEEVEGRPKPMIRIRTYLLKTKRSGQRLPRVEVEEMGPRIDFRVGRHKAAEPDRMKEAMKRPRAQEPKRKKNIETDLVGDKVGRIHIGKQDLSGLQSRKMKGLKRSRDVDGGFVNGSEDVEMADEGFEGFDEPIPKRPKS